MNSVWLLIPLALVILAGALWAFFWAVDSGQFDDLEAHGADALEDDSVAPTEVTGNESAATRARYFNCCG
ncbi:MAG: cbb3-type cytochrome oxidase assembly protein CcoS [Steroidobacteraceae bacterium]